MYLFAHRCRDVVLNIFTDNAPALRVYTHLGFHTHRRYGTGRAEPREVLAAASAP